jgi:hypothetical protein
VSPICNDIYASSICNLTSHVVDWFTPAPSPAAMVLVASVAVVVLPRVVSPLTPPVCVRTQEEEEDRAPPPSPTPVAVSGSIPVMFSKGGLAVSCAMAVE